MNESPDNYTPEADSESANPETLNQPESLLQQRFEMFQTVKQSFVSNYESWVQNSFTLRTNPEALEAVQIVSNELIQQTEALEQLYSNPTVSPEQLLLAIDSCIFVMDDIISYFETLRTAYNDSNNAPRYPELTRLEQGQYQAMQFIHEVFNALRDRITFTPLSAGLPFVDPVSFQDLASITDNTVLQHCLENPLSREAFSLIGLNNLEDY